MSYLLFLGIGSGILWIGLRTKEEVLRLSAVVAGAILIVGGFALTPMSFQMLAEVLLIVPLFFVCVRCLDS